jgi:hypothetical protein
MTISTQIDNDLDIKIEDNIIGINHFRDQILLADGEKEIYDIAIRNLDVNLISQVEDVNNYLVGVQSAYQARIDAGCRTDLFWRVVGVDMTTSPVEYSAIATKLSLSGYEFQPGGIGTVGFGSTGTVVASPSGIVTVSNLYGYEEDNLYGLKYYDEPYTKDIGDTSVATFIGTCAFATKTLVVMLPYEDGISDSFEVGQLVTSDKDGIFAGGSNTIVGLGTTTADLSKVSPGIGSTLTSVTVPTIILNVNTIGVASAPQPDGSFVSFTVLDDPNSIGSISDYEISFTKNPFSPQKIGIITGISQAGIGRSIYLDNSGNPPGPQSWKPERAVTGVEDVKDVVEPEVGAGKIYYTVGFTSAPSIAGSPVAEGATATGITSTNISLYFTTLSSCSSEETALTNSISARDTAESNFNSGISTFNSLIQAARDLRDERDDYSIRIWGLRQTIGKQTEIITRKRNLKSYIGITTIREVIK